MELHGRIAIWVCLSGSFRYYLILILFKQRYAYTQDNSDKFWDGVDAKLNNIRDDAALIYPEKEQAFQRNLEISA